MPDTTLEHARLNEGYKTIAGVDEAGRGPWAGPVVAGAVVFEPDRTPPDLLAALDDSKKLSGKQRAEVFEDLTACPAVHTGIGVSEVADIDIHNILQATLMAMARAVSNLPVRPDFALVDGNRKPLLTCDLETVVRGDAASVSIAAASIIAKVTRDRIMRELAGQFPGYGWETNAGYGTSQHRTALRHLGVTPHHRRSFKPVRTLLGHS